MQTKQQQIQLEQIPIGELRPDRLTPDASDTFAKCLNGKPDQNSAGDMGEFGNRLHDLALELNVMILFIAHHGKMTTRSRQRYPRQQRYSWFY